MEMELTTRDALLPVPRPFWPWAVSAAVIGIVLGMWLSGRLDRGRPEAFIVTLERTFTIYVLGAFVLVRFRRTRRLGLLLFIGVFIFFMGLVGGMAVHWGTPGWLGSATTPH
jgi:hypothetical protein